MERRPVAGAFSGDDLDAALAAIGDFVDLKAPFAIGHARNVAALACGAGAELSLPTTDLQLLRRAALAHDVGQLGVPNSIWDGSGPLSRSEMERVRLHPYFVDRMFASSPLVPVGRLAAEHHERLDGSGYPHGVTGSALSWRAGSWPRLTSTRPRQGRGRIGRQFLLVSWSHTSAPRSRPDASTAMP